MHRLLNGLFGLGVLALASCASTGHRDTVTLQTALVALREPGRLRDELGLLGFAVFLANTGGMILSSLLHPLLFLSVLTTGWLLLHPGSNPGPLQQILRAFSSC